MNSVLEKIRRHLIVSCQGNKDDGNPFYRPEDMLQMVDCAVVGGGVGIRVNTPPNIELVKSKYPDLPMVGIWKVVTPGCDVYITPTMKEVDRLVELGCEIIAVDGTCRKNCEGRYAYELIGEIKKKYPNQLVMADLATLHDAEMCMAQGADIISTTLSGYTEDTKDKYAKGVDLDVIKDIRAKFPNAFINAEGRIWTIDDARNAYQYGADVITVGTAITSPFAITRRFVNAINSFNQN